MIVLHFDDEFGVKRFPFAAALGAPAAWSTRSAAAKAATPGGGHSQFLNLRREVLALFLSERRAEADVIQQAFVVIQTEEE